MVFSVMAYTKRGYFLRAKLIQAITAEHYEPENHARCYKMVWQKYIYPRFGICYRSYLTYLKAEEPESPHKQLQFEYEF